MTCRLLLSDVHDIATKVGQEFQRLIEAYGCSSVSTIIPTVVEALEHLESYVEEYQKLQTQNFKLILENDSLAAARERRGKLDEDKEELVQQLQRYESEAKGLALQVERLEATNEELNRTIDKLRTMSVSPAADRLGTREVSRPTTSPGTIPEDRGEVDLGAPVKLLDSSSGSSLNNDIWQVLTPGSTRTRYCSTGEGDVLQTSRIHRRMGVMETQLERTRSTLLNTQQTIEKLTEENQALKAQLEEYRAEVALQSMQESGEMVAKETVDKPRFYKRDLLVVLTEKNELKDELNSTREELALAKTELRRLEVCRGYRPYRPRTETRVSDIIDSLTESVRLQTRPDCVRLASPPP